MASWPVGISTTVQPGCARTRSRMPAMDGRAGSWQSMKVRWTRGFIHLQAGGMPRIHGLPIPALFPDSGPVSVMLFGEAPGPRGADQSGIPFWGDGAGITVFRALAATDRAEVPTAAWDDWD